MRKSLRNDEKIDSFMSESADIFSISSDRGMDADQALRELYDEIYLNLKIQILLFTQYYHVTTPCYLNA